MLLNTYVKGEKAMMKLKYILEDDLNAIKNNPDHIFTNVLQNKENTLAQAFAKETIIQESNHIQFDDFQLHIPDKPDKKSKTDAANVRILYSHMKSLSDSIASDERIWVAYTLHEFRDYMLFRWGAEDKKILNNRYLFGYSPQASLFRNGVSRLWWIGRFTYDEEQSDPFELTDYLCSHQDYIESICGRNIFNNPIIGHTTIQALKDAEAVGIKIDAHVVRKIGMYVNLLGGMYVLDTFSKEDLYGKLRQKLGF